MKNKLTILTLTGLLIFHVLPAQTVTIKQIGKDNLFINFSNYFHFGGNFYTLENAGLNKTDLHTGEHTKLGNASFKNANFFFGVNRRLYTIDNDGSMTQIDPTSGAWSVISPMNTWQYITRVVVIGNSLYTVENSAFFYYPILNPRSRKQLGESEFTDLGIFVRGDTTLHNILSDGSIYQISLTNGSWKKIGKSRNWRSTKTGAILNNKIYTVEASGIFYETSLPDGTKKQLDDTQFKKARQLFTEEGKLYMISIEGNLFEVELHQ
jgi:hypothetical protein